MTQQTKKRKRKVKRRVRITQKARIQKKDSVQNDTLRRDTLKKMDAQMPRTVAPVLKIKVMKK